MQRFSQEIIAQGNRASFEHLPAPAFVNHTTPAGANAGREGMWHTSTQMLRLGPARPNHYYPKLGSRGGTGDYAQVPNGQPHRAVAGRGPHRPFDYYAGY